MVLDSFVALNSNNRTAPSLRMGRKNSSGRTDFQSFPRNAKSVTIAADTGGWTPSYGART